MDNYVTGAVIKRLREQKKMTQEELAQKIFVTAKAVSKWETGRGFPDVSFLEPLAKALDISVIELLSGNDIRNKNRASNLKKGLFYVCPVCANVISATGEAVISCCGITLPPVEAEEADSAHALKIEPTEDEYYVTMNHPMQKDHYISFFAAVSGSTVQFAKLYPEWNCEARFKRDGVIAVYAYCNKHGLFRGKVLREGL